MTEPDAVHNNTLTQWVQHFLNEAVLGFFALVSLFLLAAPYVFPMTPAAESATTLIEYAIVALFAVEYFSALAAADNRSEFLLDGPRIIDALIITSATIAVLPFVPDVLRNSPVLRLVRVGRATLLGARSTLALRPGVSTRGTGDDGSATKLEVLSLGAAGTGFETISWEEGLARIRSEKPDWLFLSGVNEASLAPIADALGVPVKAVQQLFKSTSPGFDTLERFSTFFVRHPLPMKPGDRLRRTPILLVGTTENVVVLSREHTDLDHQVQQRLATIDDEISHIGRATLALMGEILDAYVTVLESLEMSLNNLEAKQSALSDDAFLATTFELRADILAVRGSLKSLKSVLRDLSSGKIVMPGSGMPERAPFGFLADDAGDLYGDIDDLRESLQALVDLRLNVSSFQMNRVMRLLALLTALALIPATAGGLLGMNLTDAPWPGTLLQVAFGVAFGMILSLYIFAIKGWLR